MSFFGVILTLICIYLSIGFILAVCLVVFGDKRELKTRHLGMNVETKMRWDMETSYPVFLALSFIVIAIFGPYITARTVWRSSR